jgi:hypothetical protein
MNGARSQVELTAALTAKRAYVTMTVPGVAAKLPSGRAVSALSREAADL